MKTTCWEKKEPHRGGKGIRQDNEVLRVHYLYIRMLCEYKMFKIEPGFRKMEFKKELHTLF